MFFQFARRSGRINGSAKVYARRLRQDPCSYCGGEGGTVDHIEPYSRAGGGAMNLTGACDRCNVDKGEMPMLLWMAERNLAKQQEQAGAQLYREDAPVSAQQLLASVA